MCNSFTSSMTTRCECAELDCEHLHRVSDNMRNVRTLRSALDVFEWLLPSPVKTAYSCASELWCFREIYVIFYILCQTVRTQIFECQAILFPCKKNTLRDKTAARVVQVKSSQILAGFTQSKLAQQRGTAGSFTSIASLACPRRKHLSSNWLDTLKRSMKNLDTEETHREAALDLQSHWILTAGPSECLSAAERRRRPHSLAGPRPSPTAQRPRWPSTRRKAARPEPQLQLGLSAGLRCSGRSISAEAGDSASSSNSVCN